MNFKLTYATMFNPPAEMHTRFDAALAELNRSLGATHPLYINGEDRVTAKHDTRRSPNDQLPDFRSRNRSVMKPYGAWVVIAPYNFPFALAGGPVAAALITGNTVVLKTATDTPWSGRLLSDCIRDAGLPRGVFNYLHGSGSVVGGSLLQHANAAVIPFTGSLHVRMHIYRSMA